MEFRFFLTQNLTTSEVEEPVGWNPDFQVSLKRDLKHYGLTFEFTSELQFWGFGRDIIKNTYYTQNIDATIVLRVEYFDYETQDWVFFYEGVLVLKDLQITRLYAKCRVEEVSFSRQFRNKRDLDVELASTKTVKLHSRVIREEGYWEWDADFNEVTRPINPVRGGKANAYILPLVNKNTELEDVQSIGAYFANNITNLDNSFNGSPEVPSHWVQFKNSGAVVFSYNLIGEFRKFVTGGNNVTSLFWLVYYVGDSYNNAATTVLYQNPTGGGFQASPPNVVIVRPFSVSGTFTINVRAGQRFWFFFRAVHNSPNPVNVEENLRLFNGSYFSLVQDTKAPASSCEGIAPFDALSQIVENYTGLPNRFRSDFFTTGCGANVLLTNGYKLRQKIDKNIFASFDKLYEGLRAIFNIGFAVTREGGLDVVRVERMEYFFNPSLEVISFINLPEDDSKVVMPAMDLYFNKISVGYKAWQDERVNGLDEFNSERVYSLGIVSGQYKDVDKNRTELSIMSDLIASGSLIEKQRRLVGENTTDSLGDDALYIIALNRVSVFTNIYNNGVFFSSYPVGTVSERNEVWNVYNVISPETVYNVRFSPLQNLSRWMPYIHAQLTKNFANLKIIQFRSGSGNVDMESEAFALILGCTPLYYEDKYLEGAYTGNLPVVSQNQALFDAEFLEVDLPLTFKDFLLIKENFTGCVTVGDTAYYIISLDFTIAKGLASFKLIKKYAV